MMIRAVLILLIMGAATAGRCAQADTIHLKRGGTIEGEAVERESTVEVRISDGSTTFNKEDIDRIEKNENGTKHGLVSSSVDRLKNETKNVVNAVKRQTTKSLQGIKKQTSGWMQPIGKSKTTLAKEKALNDSMNKLQANLKKLHARDQAVAKQKRELKEDGFKI